MECDDDDENLLEAYKSLSHTHVRARVHVNAHT